MKLIAPDYYRHFTCIAGACRHSCCIGWEIDIDPDTLTRYQSAAGDIGRRLRQNISVTPEGACFRLQGREERCPFLNADGLCDLILTLGEDALCQICTDHPRFRNFFSDRTEIGLGLCCEAAGRLILGWKEPVRLDVLSDDGTEEPSDPEELRLLRLREELTALLQDRSQTVEQRMEALLESVGVRISQIVWRDWLPFFLTLERLDDHWAELLTRLADAPCAFPAITPTLQTPMEQLMVCLLFRHLSGAPDDGLVRERILLSALMWLVAAHLVSSADDPSLEELTETVRLCSGEWEYSEENLSLLLDEIAERLPVPKSPTEN